MKIARVVNFRFTRPWARRWRPRRRAFGNGFFSEANFRDLLNQKKDSQRALERAFALNQRQDWLAVRLARRYEDVSD
jgi:hypothetical protein